VPNLVKTKMCPAVIRSERCSHGTRCSFAHSEEELRMSPRPDVGSPGAAALEDAFAEQNLLNEAGAERAPLLWAHRLGLPVLDTASHALQEVPTNTGPCCAPAALRLPQQSLKPPWPGCQPAVQGADIFSTVPAAAARTTPFTASRPPPSVPAAADLGGFFSAPGADTAAAIFGSLCPAPPADAAAADFESPRLTWQPPWADFAAANYGSLRPASPVDAVPHLPGQVIPRTCRVKDRFFKTRLCTFHLRGECRRHSRCNFAHGPEELSPFMDFTFTKMCPTLFDGGICNNVGCRYAHCVEELRPLRGAAATATAAGSKPASEVPGAETYVRTPRKSQQQAFAKQLESFRQALECHRSDKAG